MVFDVGRYACQVIIHYRWIDRKIG
jgi:hypothetical protein